MGNAAPARKCPICGELLEPNETCYCQLHRYRDAKEVPCDMNGAVISGRFFVQTAEGYIYKDNYRPHRHGPALAYEGRYKKIDSGRIVEEYPILLSPLQFKSNIKMYTLRRKFKTAEGTTKFKTLYDVTVIGALDGVKSYYAILTNTTPDMLSLRTLKKH